MKDNIAALSNYLKERFNKERKYIRKEAARFKWLVPYNFITIIDVGANEGQFAKKIRYIFPNAILHCFEPIPDVFTQLKNNFKDQGSIFFYNYGLSEANEEKNIFSNEYSASSSVLEMLDLHKENFDFAVKSEPVAIKMKPLDSFFITPVPGPILLKIDVQGYEMFVLKGGESVLSQSDMIIIETTFHPLYKDQPLFEDIYDHLTARGFRYIGNVEQLVAPTDKKILQADAVFAKR